MKKHSLTRIICAAVFLFFGSAAGFSQTDLPVAGGYAAAAVTDAEIISAANFAVKAQAKKDKSKIKLIFVSKAASQVAAGMNYKLCLSVRTTDRKMKTTAPQIIEAIVFRNLKGKLSLTSWAIAACTDEVPVVVPIT